MNNKTSQEQPKRKRPRSPNYPAFPLEEAIKKIKVLYERDGKAGAPKQVAVQHLGYKSVNSGTALRNISTLKAFDLIYEKEERIFLTQRSLDIVIYSHDEARISKALKGSALKPKLYKELHDRYTEGLPSDDALRAELIGEYDFIPSKVDACIQTFRKTIAFAGLNQIQNNLMEEETQKINEEDNKPKIEKDSIEMLPNIVLSGKFPKTEMAPQHFTVPLMKGNKAVLTFAMLPINKIDLNRIKQWIDLMEGPLTETIEESPFESE